MYNAVLFQTSSHKTQVQFVNISFLLGYPRFSYPYRILCLLKRGLYGATKEDILLIQVFRNVELKKHIRNELSINVAYGGSTLERMSVKGDREKERDRKIYGEREREIEIKESERNRKRKEE